MQLGVSLGQCPVAELKQNAQVCVHVGKEAINLSSHGAPTKLTKEGYLRWQWQIARACEGAGMAWVASLVSKSRAMKVFCQIRQNALDGVGT
jgi:hypothetical protein